MVLSRLMESKLRMVYLSDDSRKFFDPCNISIVSALFLVFIPVIQLKGSSLRVSTTVQFNSIVLLITCSAETLFSSLN